MRVRTGSTRERAGFTLVEMTVVIGIIAVLAALLLGAISKARVTGQRTVARQEMSEIELATAKFKQEFGFNPPQYVEFPYVPAVGTGAGAATVAQQKAEQMLAKMFRGYNATTDRIVYRGFGGNSAGDPLKLRGIQSVVFFLSGPNGTGFQKNKPLAAAADANSKTGPYYTFEEGRFIDPDDKTGPNIYDFRDPWGTPYAYFSSGTLGGGTYDPRAVNGGTWTIPNRNDGAVLGPFRLGSARTSPWAKPGEVQIISAGPDGVFGQAYTAPTDPINTIDGGNLWVAGQGEYSDSISALGGLKGNGSDDIANFNTGTQLGTAGK